MKTRVWPFAICLALAAFTPVSQARLEPPLAELPRMERLPGEDVRLARLDLRGTELQAALRLLSELCGLNVAATEAAGRQRVDLVLSDLTAIEAVESICKLTQCWYRRDAEARSIRVLTTEEYRRDQIVYLAEEIRVFTLRHPNVVSVAGAVADLFGERVVLSMGLDEQEQGGGFGAFGSFAASGGQGGSGGFGRRGGSGAQGGAAAGFDLEGFSGSFGRSTSGGAFSRAVGGAGRARGEDRPRELLETLTSEQIAALEQAGPPSAGGEAGAWRRPAPILVSVNRMHNLIVVRTSDERAMGEIGRLVVELDRPMPQVLLEVQIIELEAGEGFRSVFDLGFASGPSSSGPPDGQPPNPLVPDAPSAPRSIASLLQGPVEGGTAIYQFVDDRIRARVQMLEDNNRLRVVARPLLLTANDRPARLFVGEERVLVTGVQTDVVTPATGATSAFVRPITEVRDVGNSVLIVPRINADRTVTLILSQDSSSVRLKSATIPVVSADGSVQEFAIDSVLTATLQATVIAKDGLTLAVGGLIRSTEVDVRVAVPLLGRLPLLGVLFRNQVRERRDSELLLLITPHVLSTPEDAAHWSSALSEAHRSAERPGDPARTPWRPLPEAPQPEPKAQKKGGQR